MNKSTNYNFNLPNSANDEVADINDISDNFVTIDSTMKTISTELQKKQVDFANILDDESSSARYIFLKNRFDTESGANIEISDANVVRYMSDFVPKNDSDLTNKAFVENRLKNFASLDFSKQTFSNALTGNKSGKNVVLSDISEVSHTLDVTVSGDTVTDFTGITLTRCGKNLFDINSAELAKCTLTDDNGILFGSKGGVIDIIVPPGQYTLSFERNDTGAVYVRNGKVDSGYIKVVGASDTSATFNFTGTVDGYLRIHTFASNLKIKNIQLELSSTASSYEAYQCATYTPSADGTVSGVTNIYPVTTLFTDTDGAVVNVKYNKDINKAFAQLQQAIINLGGTV